MKTFQLLITAMVLGILNYPSSCFSQNSSVEESLTWFDIGVGGFTSSSGSSGGSLYFSISSTVPAKINVDQTIKARFIRFIESNDRKNPNERFNSLGFMYGLGKSDFNSHISASTGISAGFGTFRDKYLGKESTSGGMFNLFPAKDLYSEKSILTIGVPVELEANLKATKSFGVGVLLFCDLNIHTPFYGFAFKVQLGQLRYTQY